MFHQTVVYKIKILVYTAIFLSTATGVYASKEKLDVRLFCGQENVHVVVLNNGKTKAKLVDSLNLYRDDVPINLQFKIATRNKSDNPYPGEWIRPQNYNSTLFFIAPDPLVIDPGSFVEKIWPIQDLVGPTMRCENSTPCEVLLKFRIVIFNEMGNPDDKYFVETPWVLLRAKNS